MNNCFSITKTAFSTYAKHYKTIMYAGLMAGLVGIATFLFLIYLPFDVKNVLLMKEIFTFDVQKLIESTTIQLKYFPLGSQWVLWMLKLGQISPLLIRILTAGVLLVSNFFIFYYILFLVHVYDSKTKKITAQRAFKALINTIIFMVIISAVSFFINYLISCTSYEIFGSIIFIIWFMPGLVFIWYELLTDAFDYEKSFEKILRFSLKSYACYWFQLLCVLLVGAVVYGLLFLFVEPSCSLYYHALVIAISNLVFPPLGTFLLYGWYKKVRAL